MTRPALQTMGEQPTTPPESVSSGQPRDFKNKIEAQLNAQVMDQMSTQKVAPTPGA